MKFFKKEDGSVSDAQAYLRSTDNVSRPTAILMSIVGFLAVFAIVFSLFLGGRWVYDRLQDDSSNTTTSELNGSDNDLTDAEGLTVVDAGGATSATNGMLDVNASAGSDGIIDGGDEDAGKGIDDREVAVEPTPEPEPIVAATELPNTGPGSTALLLIAAVVIGSGAHSLYARNRA